MAEQQVVDITDLAVLGEQFPVRLMQLGFRFIQVMDEVGWDQYRSILPPMCTVPAGPFLMGSDPQRDPDAEKYEMPQHRVTLEAYSMSTYPLTIAEYACFVQATQRVEPEDWSSQQLRPDHPVLSVSLVDTMAYADFLAQVTGEPWRVPTEVFMSPATAHPMKMASPPSAHCHSRC